MLAPSYLAIGALLVLLAILVLMVLVAVVAVVLIVRRRGRRGVTESQREGAPGGGGARPGSASGTPGQAGLPGDAAELMRLGLGSHPPLPTQQASAYTHQVKAADTPTAMDESAPAAPHRGGAFVPPSIEELQRLLPQFQIIELLGRGGMGAVYKARQISLDRVVALKILPPQIVRSAGFAERFTREARALARLNHQNVVAVHDFGHTNGLYYIVMEYVDGTNIRHMIQAGNLKPEEAMAIVPQICEALQFAHNEGIVHRDIKPENILLDKRGRVKIADFGLAKLMEPGSVDYTLTAAGGTMGTPHYMAPEQMGQAHAVDHRADIYSLGVVFYEMLTGELPIGRFAAPSKKVQIDVRLDEVVLRSLEREPDLRYQHVSEVKTDVENISQHATPGTIPIVPAKTEPAIEQSLEMSRFPLAIKVLALTSAAIMLLLIVGLFTHDVQLGTVLIITSSLIVTLSVAVQSHGYRQIRQAQERGLWPAAGEVPTLEHVKRLAQAGETILAIRLYRQMHPAPLADARDVVEKLAGPRPSAASSSQATARPAGPVVREPKRFYAQAFALYIAGWIAFLLLWNLGWAGFILSVGIFATIAWFQARHLQAFRPEIVAARAAEPRWKKFWRPSNINLGFSLAFLLILLASALSEDNAGNQEVAKIFNDPVLTDTSRDFLKTFQSTDPKALTADVRDLTLRAKYKSYPAGGTFGAHDDFPVLRSGPLFSPRQSAGQVLRLVFRMLAYPAAIPPEFRQLPHFWLCMLLGLYFFVTGFADMLSSKGYSFSGLAWKPAIALTALLFASYVAVMFCSGIIFGMVQSSRTIRGQFAFYQSMSPIETKSRRAAENLFPALDRWALDHGYQIAAISNGTLSDTHRLPEVPTKVTYQAAVLWKPGLFDRLGMSWEGIGCRAPEILVQSANSDDYSSVFLSLPAPSRTYASSVAGNQIYKDLYDTLEKDLASRQPASATSQQ